MTDIAESIDDHFADGSSVMVGLSDTASTAMLTPTTPGSIALS